MKLVTPVVAILPRVRLLVSTVMPNEVPLPRTVPEMSLILTLTGVVPPLNTTVSLAFSVPFPALFIVIAPDVVLLKVMSPPPEAALIDEPAPIVTTRGSAPTLL